MDESELTPALRLPVDDALTLLRSGELSIEGRLVDASNATLYCRVEADGLVAACVYKPVAGERPLWDFPDGTLAEREVAAYEISAASGWDVVPPTIYRDGPAGPGMVQLWIEADDETDIVGLLRSRRSERLRDIAVFDAVINNSDRKGGHLIPTHDGHIYGVDHGVSLHQEPKLRTVLWQWAADELADRHIQTLTALRSALQDELGDRLSELLTRREIRQTQRRVDGLLNSRRHPEPSDDWPAVPWPAM